MLGSSTSSGRSHLLWRRYKDDEWPKILPHKVIKPSNGLLFKTPSYFSLTLAFLSIFVTSPNCAVATTQKLFCIILTIVWLQYHDRHALSDGENPQVSNIFAVERGWEPTNKQTKDLPQSLLFTACLYAIGVQKMRAHRYEQFY